MGEGYKQEFPLDTMKLEKNVKKYIYNFQIYTVISTTWLRAGITPEVWAMEWKNNTVQISYHAS